LLFLGLVATAFVVVPGAFLVKHLMMRRRQLAEAQAYARLRALKALGQRMAVEAGATSQRYRAMAPDKQIHRQVSPHR